MSSDNEYHLFKFFTKKTLVAMLLAAFPDHIRILFQYKGSLPFMQAFHYWSIVTGKGSNITPNEYCDALINSASSILNMFSPANLNSKIYYGGKVMDIPSWSFCKNVLKIG